MDFTKILEYQKKDGELFRLERELNQNPSKKTYIEMVKIVKQTQEKSNALENRAGVLSREYEQLKQAYSDNTKQMEKFVSKDLEKVSEKDIESIVSATNSMIANLNVLEKKLFGEAESLNLTLNEFENTKKTYSQARAKYAENKRIYDAEFAKKGPEMDAIKSELSKLEKNIDPKLLSKYKQLRTDRIYPVFVKLSDRSCGGCRMELSASEVERVKANGYIECYNCHRTIIA